MGQRIDFVGGNYKMLSVSDLFDYQWEYSTKGSYLPGIASFSKRFVEKTISVAISAKSKEEYYKLITGLVEVIDRDVATVTAGRLYVGNTYLQCYFVKNEKPQRYVNTPRTIVDLTLVAEDGQWTEEKKLSFGAVTNAQYSEDGHDYIFDYPHDYTNSLVNRSVNNEGYTAADFIMTIYGSCSNPTVSIGANVYTVNASLTTGEYMQINSAERTIYKTMNNGTKVNLFDSRDRENDVFAKVADGMNAVAWGGAFGFDVTLLIKRSEPRWI